jgi:hypothetical protein
VTLVGSSIPGPSKKVAFLEKWRNRCKAIWDLFGNSPERGHKRLAEGNGARGWGFEGRTLDVEDATLYVLSFWHDKQDFKVTTLQQRTWKRQEMAWKSEGMRKEERTFRMGTTMIDTLRSLPVFVMKKGGAYYSLTMLKYATERNANVMKTLLDLRDVNRPSVEDDIE